MAKKQYRGVMQNTNPDPHHVDQKNKESSSQTSGGTSYLPEMSMQDFQKKQALRNPGKNTGRG